MTVRSGAQPINGCHRPAAASFHSDDLASSSRRSRSTPMKLNALKHPRLMALGVPLVLVSQCAPQQCAPAPAPATLSVTHVVDGDTVDLSNGERVRLIGIDAPEVGAPCADAATRSLRTMVDGHGVTIEGGARDDRDRYGRLLRYVMADGATDVGRALIGQGLAIARYDSRDGYGGHPREADYVAVDAATANACNWNPVVTPPPAPPVTRPPANGCHPAYVECLPIVDDLDCAQIGHLVHLRSIGNDPYRLDGSDNDGLGCESS
jgi:endonuclease YncB( thermonuclease family)